MFNHFIINPAAGKGTCIDSLSTKIQTVCEENGVKYEIYYTKAPLDATEYVKNCLSDKNDTHRFYACGGDGTLSEVLNGVGADGEAEIGLIPVGTGNDFWKNFNHNDFFFDIERQIKGDSLALDILSYNGKLCANMINIGFDCDVVKKTAKIKRHFWVPSKMAYLFGVVFTLFKKFGKKMRIEFEDGTVIDRKFLLTAVANGQFCGGGYDAAPKAMINDSVFDMCLIKKVSRFTFLSLVKSYKSGTYLETKKGSKVVTYLKSKFARYVFNKETDVCIDGEVERYKVLEIGILPRALRFILPLGCALIPRSDSEAVLA